MRPRSRGPDRCATRADDDRARGSVAARGVTGPAPGLWPGPGACGTSVRGDVHRSSPYIPAQVDETGLAFLKAAQAQVAILDPELAVTTELKRGSRICALTHVADRGQFLVLERSEEGTRAPRLQGRAATAQGTPRDAPPPVPGRWRRDRSSAPAARDQGHRYRARSSNGARSCVKP